MGGGEFYLNGPGHMTKMAATSSPYMVRGRVNKKPAQRISG